MTIDEYNELFHAIEKLHNDIDKLINDQSIESQFDLLYQMIENICDDT